MFPGSIDDETECELAVYGYAVAQSDRLWLGGSGSTRRNPFRPGTTGRTFHRQYSAARHPSLHMSPMPATSIWTPSLKNAENFPPTDIRSELCFFIATTRNQPC